MDRLLQSEDSAPIGNIIEYLWWHDLSAMMQVSKRANEVLKRPVIAESMFNKLINKTYRYSDIKAEVMDGNDDAWPLLARRISSWPKSADVASLSLVSRNVRIVSSPRTSAGGRRSNNNNNHSSDPGCCVVYEGRKKESHKGSAVVTSDDYFPCLPGAFTTPQPRSEGKMQAWERLPLVELQKKKKEGVVSRTMAPFCRVSRPHITSSSGNNGNNNNIGNSSGNKSTASRGDEEKEATGGATAVAPSRQPLLTYLSCIAYFEVDVLHNLGYSAMDDFRRFSIGLACALFPLRGKKQLGFDQHSFGYHREGSLMHGCRKFAQMPPYSPGDTVGCGLIYPPLTNGPIGKIFFTKNGQLVGMFDMGVESLLSLPWFPALGLAPNIPMEFNFGVHRRFMFDVLEFESVCIHETFPGSGWEFFQSLAAEQELTLRPSKYAIHPMYSDHAAAERTSTDPGAGAGSSSTNGSPSHSHGHSRHRGSSSRRHQQQQHHHHHHNHNHHHHHHHHHQHGMHTVSSVSSSASVATHGSVTSDAESLTTPHTTVHPASANNNAVSPGAAGIAFSALGSSTLAHHQQQHHHQQQPPATVAAAGGGQQQSYRARLPSATYSLYLDNDIRTATWLGISDTRRVTFQCSDDAWEGSAEGDGDEGDSEDEADTVSEGSGAAGEGSENDNADSDSMQISSHAGSSSNSSTARGGGACGKKRSSRKLRGSSRGRQRGQLVSVLRDCSSVAMDVMMPAEAVSDLYPGRANDNNNHMSVTGLRRGSGAIAREGQTSLNDHSSAAGSGGGITSYHHYDASGSVTSDGDGTLRDGYDSATAAQQQQRQQQHTINKRELEGRIQQMVAQGLELGPPIGGAGTGQAGMAPAVTLTRSLSYGSSGGSIISEGIASDGTGHTSRQQQQQQAHQSCMSPCSLGSSGPKYAELRSHEQILALEASYGYQDGMDGMGDAWKYNGGDNDHGHGSGSDDSVATSMFVEVASVDGDGSYKGYGGGTPSESEVDEEGALDLDSDSGMYGGDGYGVARSSSRRAQLRASATSPGGSSSRSRSSSNGHFNSIIGDSSGNSINNNSNIHTGIMLQSVASNSHSHSDNSPGPGHHHQYHQQYQHQNRQSSNGSNTHHLHYGASASISPGFASAGDSSFDEWSSVGGQQQRLPSLNNSGNSSSNSSSNSSRGSSRQQGRGRDRGTLSHLLHQQDHSQQSTAAAAVGLMASSSLDREDGYDGASETGRNDEDVDMGDEDASHGTLLTAPGIEEEEEEENEEREEGRTRESTDTGSGSGSGSGSGGGAASSSGGSRGFVLSARRDVAVGMSAAAALDKLVKQTPPPQTDSSGSDESCRGLRGHGSNSNNASNSSASFPPLASTADIADKSIGSAEKRREEEEEEEEEEERMEGSIGVKSAFRSNDRDGGGSSSVKRRRTKM